MKTSTKKVITTFFSLCLFTTCAVSDGIPRIVPIKELTPGDTYPVTLEQICTKGYTIEARAVSFSTKTKVYKSYGIYQHKVGEFEVDHLVPLSLGGSNSVKNLWPQPSRVPEYGSFVKDRLENKLHRLVCSKKVALQDAQTEISVDWISTYHKYLMYR